MLKIYTCYLNNKYGRAADWFYNRQKHLLYITA